MGDRERDVAAALFVATCAGYALVWTQTPEPVSFATGAILFAVAAFGAGLLAGRWWSVLLAVLFVPIVIVLASEAREWFFAVMVGVPAAAVALLAGVAVRRALARGWGATLRATAAALALVGAVPVAAFAVQRLRGTIDATPERPLVVDTRRGTFDGLRLGDGEADVRRRFGPARCSSEDPAEPLDEDFHAIGGPTSFAYRSRGGSGVDRACVMRYRRLAVFLDADGVHAFVTTSPRAQTEHGVGVGDSAALAEQRIRGARCEIANEGTEYVRFPLCRARVAPSREVFLGGDRIRSVWLVASSRRGLGRGRRR